MAKRTPENNRRKLIEEQRKKARAKERRTTILFIGLASVLGIALIGAAVYIAQQEKGPDVPLDTIGVAAEAAGCDETKEVEIPKTAKNQHVTQPVAYDSAPPTYGDHHPQPFPLGKKFYSRGENPIIERAVHNMEHGYVVVWYDPKATDAQVDLLRAAGDAAEGKFLFVPWTRGDFSADKHIGITGWGFTQSCTEVSGAVIQTFFDQHGGPNGKAPEKNVI